MKAADFKAKCLSLMDEVRARKTEIVVTKRGKAVARLVPVDAATPGVLGCMAGTAEVRGDLLEPVVGAAAWHVLK